MESQKQERGVKKMKRVAMIIALASIFSFILSYPSLISSLQQRLHLLSMYSNLVDKKHMFLLCNGIVGFILGNFRGNFETLLHGKAINIIEETKEVVIKDVRESEVKEVVALLGQKSASKEEEEQEQERVDLLRGGEEEVTLGVEDDDEAILVQDLAIIRINDHDHDGGNDEGILVQDLAIIRINDHDHDGGDDEGILVQDLAIIRINDHDHDHDGGDDEGILVQDLAIIRISDHDHGGGDDDSLLSSEDLNKKCEDFIRKVKAEIRSESRKLITF